MRVYKDYLKLHFKTLLQYKVSFILSFVAQVAVFFSSYFMILALFNKFNNIRGFTLYEVLLCFAIINFGFVFNQVFFRGLDHFDRLIIRGEYDRLLIRPQPILIQVLGYEIDYAKIAQLLQSIIILIIAIVKLNINWTLLKLLALIFMMISSILIFFGIMLLAASYCFITIEGLEVRNLFTHGGKHMAQYPIGIFKKIFAYFFTFIIPYGCVNYYPLLYILGKSNNHLMALTPLVAVIYLIPCFLIFKLGMKKYNSTGS